MEEQLIADRAHLRRLLHDHPDWPYQEYADQIGRPRDWVKRWVKRLRAAPPDDESVLWNRSSARHHLPPPLDPSVIDRILEIRDQPPEHLQRAPGPKAILYYLHRQEDLLAQGLRLPRSTRTIWQILTEYGRIGHTPRRVHVPLERPGPLVSWQIDLKDADSVPPDPDAGIQATLRGWPSKLRLRVSASVKRNRRTSGNLGCVVSIRSQTSLRSRLNWRSLNERNSTQTVCFPVHNV